MKPLNVGNWLTNNLERMAENMDIKVLENFVDRLVIIINRKENEIKKKEEKKNG